MTVERNQLQPGDSCMHRVLNRATPMLKAARTEKATVVLEPDDERGEGFKKPSHGDRPLRGEWGTPTFR